MERYIIRKKYHFYAGHRNEDLIDKCFSPHGHSYFVNCWFDLPLGDDGNITVLFGDIDNLVEPIIKGEYDHSFLMHKNDPLYKCFKDFCKEQGCEFKMKVFDEPTSVENLAKKLYNEIRDRTNLNLIKIEVKETTSSAIEYSECGDNFQ